VKKGGSEHGMFKSACGEASALAGAEAGGIVVDVTPRWNQRFNGYIVLSVYLIY
jgi:hypothetical protein